MQLSLPTTNLNKADGVTVKHEHGRWLITARVNRQGNRFVLVGLSIAPRTNATPPGGLQHAHIRGIPVARFAPFAEAAIARFDPASATGRLFLEVANRKLRPKTVPARPRPRRAFGRDDRFYAEVAAEYLDAHHHGSRSPVRDLAKARKVTPAQARDLVHEARVRGLLSPGTPGSSGGRLLERALVLLAGKELS